MKSKKQVAPDLAEELYRRYVQEGSGSGRARRMARFFVKKYLWLLVVRGAEWVKRALDVLVSGMALLVLAPLFGAVALCIWATDRGPAIFVQKRVGKWGREIDFPKFRSMVVNADELKKKLMEQNQHGEGGVTFKMKRDPRVTWIGRIIRKLSIDEAPQLWSVLKGDMSLVGPRPPTVEEVQQYTLADRRRLDVRPGLTCIWQVSGRADIPFDKQVKLDVQYIESQSLLLDFLLLLKTVPAVLLGRGAY